MAVLIVCEPADVHASAVAWALEQYGVEATPWHPAPPLAPASLIRFDSRSMDYHFAGKAGGHRSSDFDAVWLRRWPEPAFPPEFRVNGKRNSEHALLAYHAGLLELLPRGILWANSLDGRRSASYAPRQLAAAQAAGFTIPRTVVTDDTARARAFVDAHDGAVVHKPLHPRFRTRTGHGVSHPAPVMKADLNDPRGLVWSPGIFQEVVAKAYKLRVTVFGRTCVAARICDPNPVDGTNLGMSVTPDTLPDDVERRLLGLMDELGLVMAMADFIVTPDGEHVFLEVDEQGQFLWDEEVCPELPLLDTAARFLASGDPGFATEIMPGRGLGFDDYMQEEAARHRQARSASLRNGGPSQRLPFPGNGHLAGQADMPPRKAGLL